MKCAFCKRTPGANNIARLGLRAGLWVAVLGLTLIGSQQVFAAPIPILDDNGFGPARNDFDGTVGYDVQFVGSGQAITALGLWDQGLNGFTQAHQVGLWNNVGALIGNVLVPAGTGASLVGEFRYINLGSPVTLTTGQTYTLGVEVFAGGDTFQDVDFGVGYAPAFVAQSGRYNVGGGFAQPVSPAGYNAPYAGPNALFAPVPEPASSVLLLIGVGALWIVKARKRK